MTPAVQELILSTFDFRLSPCATASRYCGGRPRVPVTFFLLAQEESNQRRRAPRFAAATSQARSGIPALLVRPGGLRNSRTVIITANSNGRDVLAELARHARLAQCSPETPGRSALLGGSQGPQQHERRESARDPYYPLRFHPYFLYNFLA